MENGPFIDGLPIHPMKNGDFRYVNLPAMGISQGPGILKYPRDFPAGPG
jgi:hypothetical protein